MNPLDDKSARQLFERWMDATHDWWRGWSAFDTPACSQEQIGDMMGEAFEAGFNTASSLSHELPNTQKPGVLATAPQADTLESGLTGRRDGQFIAPPCPGMDKCLRVECVSRCAIHGPQYIKDVAIPMLDAIMEPCKGCGKRPIDFIEGEGAAPSSISAPSAFAGVINALVASRCYACGWPLGSCKPFDCGMRYSDNTEHLAEKEGWHKRAEGMAKVWKWLVSMQDTAQPSAIVTPEENEPTVLADLEEMLDAAIINDSYGVHGSDFIHCLKCGHSNGPGKYWKEGDWHEPGCTVKRLRLKYELDKPSAATDGGGA